MTTQERQATAAPTPRARGAAREAAICQAALELLAEIGFDRMSMDAVAARARASKATIYRRWSGKYDLVLDAVRSRAVHQVVPADTGTLRGDLVETMRSMAAGLGAEDAALILGALRAMRAAPELGNCMRAQVIEDRRSTACVIVDRAVRRGELPATADADLLHEVAPALLFFRLIVTGDPVDDAFVEHAVDDVLIPILRRR